jgi:hypothetical protein
MAATSLLARLGLRIATLGSAASLAIAAPTAEGNVAQTAHTAATRTGFYFPANNKIAMVANALEVFHTEADGAMMFGNTSAPFYGPLGLGAAWHQGQVIVSGAAQLSATIAGSQCVLQVKTYWNGYLTTLRIAPSTGASMSSFEFLNAPDTSGNWGRMLGVAGQNGMYIAADGSNNVNGWKPLIFRCYHDWTAPADSIVIGRNQRVGITMDASGTGVRSDPTYLFQINNGTATILAYVTDLGDWNANGITMGRGSGNIASNTVFGSLALSSATTATSNTAIGLNALRGNLTGGANTAVGSGALRTNTAGGSNTAIGVEAQFATTGSFNSSLGRNTLFNNTTGSNNTAVGFSSMITNTIGNYNTALGVDSLRLSSSGDGNVAVGSFAMYTSDGVSNITAVGYEAARSMVGSAVELVAVGYQAARAYLSGYGCTIIGNKAGLVSTSGAGNTLVGSECGYTLSTGQFNTAIGLDSLWFVSTGTDNIAIGYRAARYNAGINQYNGSRGVYIGNLTRCSLTNETDAIVIGNGAQGNGSFTATWGSTSIIAHYFTGAVNIAGTLNVEGITTAVNGVSIFRLGSSTVLTGAAGATQYVENIIPTINQSATAGFSILRIAATYTTTGSGQQRSLDIIGRCNFASNGNTDAIAYFGHPGFNGMKLGGVSQGITFEVAASVDATAVTAGALGVFHANSTAITSAVEWGYGLAREANIAKNSGAVLACVGLGRDFNGTDTTRTLVRVANRNPTASLALSTNARYFEVMDYDSTLSSATDIFWIDSSRVVNIGLAENHAITQVATNTALNATHYTILVDASGGAVTISLPDSTATNHINGRVYVVKKIDATANAVTVQRSGASDLIDGATTSVMSTQYQARTYQCRTASAAANRWNII